MTRKALTLKAKVEAMEANALCPKCFKPYGGDVQYDHEIPLGLNGPDHDEKPLFPLHKNCHDTKTKKDIARIAKANRQGLRTGQQARRAARDKPLLQTRNTLSKAERDKTKAWKESLDGRQS